MIASIFRRLALGAAVMVGALGSVGVAHAHGGVSWSLGISTPGVGFGVAAPTYYNPPPVYYNPPPVYYNPPPVYVQPPPSPVYYNPQPVYTPPPVYVAPQPIYYGPPRDYYRHQHSYYGPPPYWRGGGYGDWRR